MILILLKIRANIPVILMGETGCGKTSLIKMLSKLLNNGDEKKMIIFKIHAGITDKDIIDFIKNELLEEAEKIKKEDDKEEKKLQKGQIYIRKKLWVLLDKINTCKSMELISELMCKNSYQGTRLPSNIVFIATCNPYRCYENEKIKRNDNNNLVYKVNPLPHSLLNYIFDFGHLEPNDEKKYIQTILEEPIKRINKKENYLLSDEQIKKIHIFGTELVSKAQNFTRKIIEISSVSLRDIRRFNIIYEFFYYYLKQKKEDAIIKEENSIKIDIFYKDCDYLTLHKYAIILGVFMCYYLRISDNKTREKFSQEMTDKMRDLDEFFDRKSFLDIPYREEYYILDNIEIEKGIAQNRALLENIFSLFVAINTKIPIFIVGKPGSSKTLSVQLINKAMKGSSSNNFFFKKYPRIILTSYQGTLSSTSKGIENTFIQAKEKYEKINEESKDNNISLVFFDQIGITEFSQNNPLSIINDHLEEFDERKNKISFVGISNWALDPSKMNRGLNLFICEPTEEDLKCSAFTIGESYDKNLVSKYKVFYKGLSSAYYKYKRYLKRAHKKDGKEDFHGIIDFYYLIKYCTKELIKNNIKKEEDIVFLGLERNFGGFKFIPENSDKESTSIEMIKNFYSRNCNDNNYNALERIKENIDDIECRYLLAISKSSTSIFLLSEILSKMNKNYNLIFGSQFYGDYNSEEYSTKILNKIKLYMEEGKILILKNLEHIYPALFELFNRNFIKINEKNYLSITMSSSENKQFLVNDEFRCIISVNYEQIAQEETSFINRFEKHIISFDYLLSNNLEYKSRLIFDKLKEMISLDKTIYKGINYDLQKLFINFDLEEIQGIIYQASKKGIPKYDLINEVISKISLTLPQDIILCLKLNGFYAKYPELKDKILEEYNKGEHHNLRRFLESMTNSKNIVYTYTNNLEKIKNLKDIKNAKFGEISLENIKEIKISSCKSENDLEKEIDEFYIEDKYKICLIKFNTYEGKFINYVQFLIQNKENELLEDKKRNTKVFIFIINIIRVYDPDLNNFKNKSKKRQNIVIKKILKETVSNLSEYYQIFIDNLNGVDNIRLDKIFNINELDIFKDFINFKDELSKNIYITLSYIKLNIQFSFGELNEETYIEKLINFLDKNEYIKDSFNNCVKKQLGLKGNEEDLIINIFKQKDSISSNDKDILGIINEKLSHIYKNYLAQFYFIAENDNFFATLLSLEEEKKFNTLSKEYLTKFQEKIIQTYFLDYRLDRKSNIIKNQGQKSINIYFGLKIPKIIRELKQIVNFIREEIKEKYIKNQNNI